jgi:hypothetical protein
MVDSFQIFVAFSEYLHFICNLFVPKEIEIFERMEFILWWKTLWYSLLTIVECSTNFLERKNAPARQWQSVINPAGQQLRCDAQWADIWNFVWKPSMNLCKVEKILKGSPHWIPLHSSSVKIQIIGRKVFLRCKGKTLLVIINKLSKTKCLLTSPSNVLPYYLK